MVLPSSTHVLHVLGDDYELADQTSLMWAYERGHDDIVTLLKHYRRNDEDYHTRGDYTPSG